MFYIPCYGSLWPHLHMGQEDSMRNTLCRLVDPTISIAELLSLVWLISGGPPLGLNLKAKFVANFSDKVTRKGCETTQGKRPLTRWLTN
jgi:hypothetical protein